MHWLVWVASHTGPRPQLWTHNPEQTVDGYWHAKQGRVLAMHSIPVETTKTLDQLAAMFPAPAAQEATPC